MHLPRMLCIAVLAAMSGFSIAQTPNAPIQRPAQDSQPATKLEAFLGKKGRLVAKEFYPISSVSNVGKVELNGLVIYEPGGSAKTKGLRVEVTEGGRLERSNTSFVDVEELQGLSEALTYIESVAEKWKSEAHEPYTELVYSSKGELNVGFYQNKKDSSFFVSSGRIGAATAFLKVSDIARFKQAVDQATTLLSSK